MDGPWSRRAVLGGLTLLAAPWPARAADPTRLPLSLRAGKLFVPVTVNGTAVDAILDTGATRTALDLAFAATAGVKTDGRFTGEMIQNRVSGAKIPDLTVRLGDMALRTRRAVAVDFSRNAPGYGTPVRVLLGRELFEQFVVELDFESGLAGFFPRVNFTPPPQAPIVLRPERGRMTAPVRLEDFEPLYLRVDIGSDLPLILSPSPQARRLLQNRPTSTALIGGEGGAVAQVASVKRLEFAGAAFGNVPFQVAPRSLGGDGVLGLPVLRRYRVTLDFGGLRMWLAPSASPAAPFERDRSGMNAIAGADGLRVTHVARGGPAEKAGLKVGDLIVTIDGEMALTANANLTGAPVGKVLDLALSDGTRKKLTLAEYY